MKCHGVILLVSAWLMSTVLHVEAAQLGSGSGGGDSMSILMPEESTTAGVVTPRSTAVIGTSPLTTATLSISPTTTLDTAPTTTVIFSSEVQTVTTSQAMTMSQLSTTATMDSSSITETDIETTTTVSSSEDRMTTLSAAILPTFTSAPQTSLSLMATPTSTTLFTSTSISTLFPTAEPTSTMATTTIYTTTVADETSTTEQTTTGDATTTDSESDITTTASTSASGTATKKKLSTVEILIIVVVVIAFLIILFVVAICVFAVLLCKRSKKEDPVKKEILSNWELQEPPRHGGARLMKIRTLDSMEEIDDTPEGAGVEGNDREGEPSGVVNRNVREMSDGGNNTAFTFGVPMGVVNTVGKANETAMVTDSKQNGGSENGGARQTGIKEANGLEKNKASGGTLVVEAPPTTKETTFITTTFGPIPSMSEIQPSLKISAGGESSDAVLTSHKEKDKPSQDIFLSGQKSELEQNLLPNEDVERVLGGVFRDLEVSTQL